MRNLNKELSPLEQITEALEKQLAYIEELKTLKANTISENFKNEYQNKINEQVKIYNEVVSKF